MSEDFDDKKDYLKWKNKKTLAQKSKRINDISSKRSWLNEVEKITALEKSYNDFDSDKANAYEDFPLSTKTKAGLRKCGFSKPTAIQKASILSALQGKDILGAAKTGSGKTLAFLIPLLECLYRHRWNAMDGPGALVISPTRELALQTFEVLCKVGSKHDFSAGLVIGGKNVKEEAERVSKTNIVICTPGRLLQHFDTTSYFHMSNLKILVLDEADRILDLGFSTTMNAILENLPTDRQTLLFSATQTKNIKDLARLSLNDPVYISVHAESRHSTPSGLKQRYVVCPLNDKISMLYSFIRNHVKTKTLVFVSSCKQVQFLFAAFSLLRPGVSVMHLHGRMNQMRRMAVYQEFCRKKFALLIATDIAARGLDFPAVDWVVQLDCPEDAETYIHRVGRTARFHTNGNALLVLLPSEEKGMVKELQKKKVPVEASTANMQKLTKIDNKLQSFCAEDLELKEKAKRCFVAYFKAIHLMRNKSIFNVRELPMTEYAASLGLAIAPRIRFLQRLDSKNKSMLKNVQDQSFDVHATNDNPTPSAFHVSDDEDNFFSIKQRDVAVSDIIEDFEIEPASKVDANVKQRTKAQEAKRLQRKGVKINKKITFDDDGVVQQSWPPLEENSVAFLHDDDEDENIVEGINLDEAKVVMQKRDVQDRERHRKKVAAKHKKARLKAKEQRRQLQLKLQKHRTDEDMSFGSEENLCSNISDEKQSEDEESFCLDNKDTFDQFSSIPKKRMKFDKDIDYGINDENSNFKMTKSDCNKLSLQDEEELALQLLKN